MRIVINDEDLEKGVLSLIKHLPGNKILIDHFLDRCQEAEIDAIFDGCFSQARELRDHEHTYDE